MSTKLKKQVATGGVPVGLILEMAEPIVNAIIDMFKAKATLRKRVTEIERVCEMQAKQIAMLKASVDSLMGRPKARETTEKPISEPEA